MLASQADMKAIEFLYIRILIGLDRDLIFTNLRHILHHQSSHVVLGFFGPPHLQCPLGRWSARSRWPPSHLLCVAGGSPVNLGNRPWWPDTGAGAGDSISPTWHGLARKKARRRRCFPNLVHTLTAKAWNQRRKWFTNQWRPARNKVRQRGKSDYFFHVVLIAKTQFLTDIGVVFFRVVPIAKTQSLTDTGVQICS